MLRFRLIPCLLVLLLASAALSQAPYVRTWFELGETATMNDPSDGYSVIWRSTAGVVSMKTNESSSITTHRIDSRGPIGYSQISVEASAAVLTPPGTSSDFSQKFQITSFATNNSNSSGSTPDNAEDHITITSAGVYRITFAASIVMASTEEFSFSIFKNNGATRIGPLQTVGSFSSTLHIPITVAALASLSASDTIEVWAQRESGSGNLLVSDASLTVEKVGD